MNFKINNFIHQLIFLFIYLFFIENFEDIISSYLIHDHLDKICSYWVKDVLVSILFLSILVLFIIKGTKRKIFHDWNFILIIVMCLGIYSYHRITDTFPFTPFELCNKIKYADVFVFVSIYVINSTYRFPLKDKKGNEKKVEIKKELIQDIHKTFDNKDLFFRSKLISEIVEYIDGTMPKKSFAIGIIGRWGSGKSVFLNTIEEVIKQKNKENNEYIIIKFNPWLNNGKEEIVKDFFNNFKEALGEKNPKLTRLIKSYSEKIINIEVDFFTKIFKQLFQALFKSKTLNEEHEEIEDEIVELGKKIIVFIDDLDRLSGDEILETFRIIRNTANFPNVFFIVAYDHTYIHSIINNVSYKDGQNYLEKIFQLEIPLPHYQKSTVITTLLRLLTDNKSEEDRIQITSAINELRNAYYEKSTDFISAYIVNLRDAIRYANSINISFELIKADVDLVEYFHLEFIKLKFKEIHQLIGSQKIITITSTKSKDLLNNKSVFIFNLEGFKTYVNDENINITPNDISKINLSLGYIFRNKEKISPRSIVDPSNLLIYFTPELYNKISLRDYKEFKSGPKQDFFRRIEGWLVDAEKDDLIKILTENDAYENRKDFERSIETMFYLSKHDVPNLSQTLISLILHPDPICIAYYDNNKEEYKDFLIKVLTIEVQSLIFYSGIVSDLIRYLNINQSDKKNIEFILSKDDLKEIAFGYLFQYLNNNSYIDSTALILYENNIDFIDDDNKINITSKANEFLKKIIVKSYHSFLERLVIKNDEDKNTYILYPFLKQIFGGYQKFETLLNDLFDQQIAYEIKTFYNFFKANDYLPITYNPKEYVLIPSDKSTNYILPDKKGAYRESKTFMHPHFLDIYIKYPIFSQSKWIAHTYPITNQEASNGGEYIFKKNFYLDQKVFEGLTVLSFSFIVDDELTLKLNGKNVITDKRTKQEIYKIDFHKTDLQSGQNEFDFIIKNDNPGEVVEAMQNPYGLIYVIKIEYKLR